MKRGVITGLGAVTPLGNSLQSTWEAMLEGKSGANLITRFDTTNFKTKFACEVKDFDPLTVLDRKEARKFDRFTLYAIAVAQEAMKDSCLDLQNEDLNKFGVVWGSGVGGIETFENEVIAFAKGDGIPRYNPFFIPKFITDIAAGQISIMFGLKGLNYSTTSACASSAHAIADSFYHIRDGRATVIVTGGSEAPIIAAGMGGFNSMHALSTRNDDYETASRPFSQSRDGFVLGEGGACLILEEYEHAVKRGAKIYAEIVGAGMTADAYHITAPHPEGDGAVRVMNMALDEAQIQPEQVDYINAHGTSTSRGDVAEIMAIQKLFGNHAEKLNISSTKSMTGHLLGAAGAIEAIACVLAIKDSVIPPTINHQDGDDDPELPQNLNYTFNQKQPRNVDYALSNTFGFGGHNTCLLFKKV